MENSFLTERQKKQHHEEDIRLIDLVTNMLRPASTEVAVIIAGVVAIVLVLVLSSLSLKIGKNIALFSLSGSFVNKIIQPNGKRWIGNQKRQRREATGTL
ncbi:MAG TPA: hypothetical protein VKA95_06690 [Nitrososphaeraceae archaeon]|nr:hypothetical protein [Nitrososphaeraceae archaeon]